MNGGPSTLRANLCDFVFDNSVACLEVVYAMQFYDSKEREFPPDWDEIAFDTTPVSLRWDDAMTLEVELKAEQIGDLKIAHLAVSLKSQATEIEATEGSFVQNSGRRRDRLKPWKQIARRRPSS